MSIKNLKSKVCLTVKGTGNTTKWYTLNEYTYEQFIEQVSKDFDIETELENILYLTWSNIPECFINEYCIAPSFWDYMNSDIYGEIPFDLFVGRFPDSANVDDFEKMRTLYKNSYQGEWASREDFAEQLHLINCEGEITEPVDYIEMAKALFKSDYCSYRISPFSMFSNDTRVYVFDKSVTREN